MTAPTLLLPVIAVLMTLLCQAAGTGPRRSISRSRRLIEKPGHTHQQLAAAEGAPHRLGSSDYYETLC